MTRIYSFRRCLDFSRGTQEERDMALLDAWIDGATNIAKTDTEVDKSGVDYIATLRNGAQIHIDAKRRKPDCAKFWTQGPELALEKWSVIPTRAHRGKVGWTLNEASGVHCILFTFDPADTNEAFLLPFQHLRMAYRRNLREWERRYKTGRQYSSEKGHGWQSSCVFVPAIAVIAAINQVSRAITKLAPSPALTEEPAYQLIFPGLQNIA